MKVKDVKPGDIRRDGDTQPRASLDNPTVEEYIEAIENGDTMPPLDVFYDGKNYWLADGFHRFMAMTRLHPRGSIKCNVHKGNRRDAQWHSYSANQAHGLRRSSKDKSRATKLALTHPNGAELSDRQIAKHVGVDVKTIGKYRAELESSVEIPKIDKRIVKRNGKTYKQNTAKIGKRSGKGAKSAKPKTSGVKAFKPKRGHSEMSPMICFTLPVNKPEVTAATLWQEFSVSYIETLVEIFSKYIQEEKGE